MGELHIGGALGRLTNLLSTLFRKFWAWMPIDQKQPDYGCEKIERKSKSFSKPKNRIG
jgi:hypothetical protein